MLGIPSFITGVLLALSYKHIAFVELLTPVILILFSLTILVVNLTEVCGTLDNGMRQQQAFLVMIVFSLVSLFMGATWQHNFIARSLLWMPLLTVMQINRTNHGDEMNIAQGWLISFAAEVALEISIYANMKAKAQLFLKGKTTE